MKKHYTLIISLLCSSITAYAGGLVSPSISGVGGGGNWIWERNILYVSKGGNDSTASRNNSAFLTINAASDAAQSGDIIVVGAGVYNENHINRPGKTLTFDFRGAAIHYEPAANDTASLGLIDDRDGACTNYIIGKPNIYYSTGTNFWRSAGYYSDDEEYALGSFGSTNCGGCIYITNAATILQADLGDVTFLDFNLDVVASGIQHACFDIKDCAYCSINYNRLRDGCPILATVSETFGGNVNNYVPTLLTDPDLGDLPVLMQENTKGCVWNNGLTIIHGKEVEGFSYAAVWSAQDRALTTEQDFYWTVEGDQYSKIYTSAGLAGASNLVSWFVVNRLVATNGFGASGGVCALDCEGGKNYFSGMKVQGSGLLNTAVACTTTGNTTGDASYCYLAYNCQKTAASGRGPWLSVSTNTGGGQLVNCYFNSLQWDYNSTNSAPGGMIVNSGGNLRLSGGPIDSITNGVALWCTNGGKTTVTGMTIDNSAAMFITNYPVVIGAGASVFLNNCTVFSKAGGYSIFANQAAQAVTLAKTATNSPVNANVTVTTW